MSRGNSHLAKTIFPVCWDQLSALPTSCTFLNPPSSPPTQGLDNQPTYPGVEDSLLQRQISTYTRKNSEHKALGVTTTVEHERKENGWYIHPEVPTGILTQPLWHPPPPSPLPPPQTQSPTQWYPLAAYPRIGLLRGPRVDLMVSDVRMSRMLNQSIGQSINASSPALSPECVSELIFFPLGANIVAV